MKPIALQALKRDDVLIDNLTLTMAAPFLENPNASNPAEGYFASSLLEAIILHERLIFDPLWSKVGLKKWAKESDSALEGAGSMIMEQAEQQTADIERALSILPKELIQAIKVTRSDKTEILNSISRVLPKTDFNWEWFIKIFEDDVVFFQLSKRFKDQIVNELSRIIANMNIEDQRTNELWYFRTTGSIKKQAYYLGLSQFIGIPYLPNTVRNKAYKAMMVASNDGSVAKKLLAIVHTSDPLLIEEALLSEFEQKVIARIDNQIETTLPWQTFRIPLPALTQAIFTKSTKVNASLIDIALEMRDSKNAKAFRKWCHEILLAYEERDRLELLRLLQALQNECRYWESKMAGSSNVSIGISLFGLNFEQEAVNPIYETITKHKRHILFLRDLI